MSPNPPHKNMQKIELLQRQRFFVRLLLSFASGAACAFSQAPTSYLALIFIGFSLFYILYDSCKTTKQAFFCGFSFAFGYFLIGLYWIGNALLVEGNEAYRWAYPLAVIALPFALSFFTAIATALSHRIFLKRTLGGFLGFCTLLALSEWCRGHFFTGFPWNLYGYCWLAFLPIAQLSSLIGSYGLTFLTIIWASSLGFLLLPQSEKNKKQQACTISLLFLTLSLSAFYGTWRLSHTETTNHPNLEIKIIQPNIAQADKWKPEKLVENFEQLLSLSEENINPAKKTLIIWPETALPPTFIHNTAVNQRIDLLRSKGNISLLSGGLDIERPPETNTPLYYNALHYWGKNDTATRLYTKSHLVPFGEYIPFQQWIPLKTVTSFSGFERGQGAQTIALENIPSFSPLICYESIFPQEAIEKDNRPEWILILTNDGWYGKSAGPYQHLAQARFRAIEQGIPVIRVANTGVSAVIDPLGRILKKRELMTQGSITTLLPQKLSRKTYYGMSLNKIKKRK